MNAEAVRAWLEARYDEDERIAKAAKGDTSGRWQRGDYHAVETAEPDPWDIIVYSDGPTEEQADHIVRHDPARALVEVTAKRRRLERHTLGGFTNATQSPFCGWCTEGYDGRTSEPDASVLIVPWPCPDIIDDAQSWADRDDFPAELRLP